MSKEMMTKSVMKDIQVALRYFKTEYGRYPVQADETKILRSAGVLLVSLMAEHPLSNPRNIKFIDLPFTKEIGGGIIDHAGGADRPPKPENWELRDIWGEQFHVLIDSNEDGQIQNPEAGGKSRWFSRYVPTPTLQTNVAIFSSGPDRDSNTWEDNICSWR